MIRILVLAVLAIVLAACEAEATPAPPLIPDTPTVAPSTATAAPPVRYGLLPNTDGFISSSERNQLAQFALVDDIQQDSGSILAQDTYDIIAGYGIYDGWELSPQGQSLTIVINTELAPLDDPEIVEAIITNSQAEILLRQLQQYGATADVSTQLNRVELRSLLANKGYPDGILLNTVYQQLPGFAIWRAQLGDANITLQASLIDGDFQSLLATGQFHLAFLNAANDESRSELTDAFGEDNVINLYNLPISYQLRDPNIRVIFSESGWPIPQRGTLTEASTPTPPE